MERFGIKALIAVIVSVIMAVSVFYVTRSKTFVYNLDAESLAEGEYDGAYVICRCHTSDNTCYGGNLISFRAQCYMGPLVDCTHEDCPE